MLILRLRWAIRNCGLLLIRSLIDCLFGTSESKLITETGWDGRSVKLSYQKYPALPELLLKLLDKDTDSFETKSPAIGAIESVFPALDIIRRAGPPTSLRDEIYACVIIHLGSKVWHVRELAARTTCTLLLHKNWLLDITELFRSWRESLNWAHGVLMVTRFVLERRLALDSISAFGASNLRISRSIQLTSADGLESLVSILHQHRSRASHCPETLAAYLEVINAILAIIAARRNSLISPAHMLEGALLQSVLRLLPPGNPYQQLLAHTAEHCEASTSRNSSTSLLLNASIRQSVVLSILQEDPASLRMSLIYIDARNPDAVLEALRTLVLSTQMYSESEIMLAGVLEAYVALIDSSKLPEVQSTALSGLTDLIDRQSRFSTGFNAGSVIDRIIQTVRRMILKRRNGPDISNSEIKASGCLLMAEFSSGEEILGREEDKMYAFSEMLSNAGNPYNVSQCSYTLIVND